MTQRRSLTRDEVLRTALELADQDGLDAVSMRAVAARLGVTPMALYRHVGDKDAMLDGLVELLLVELGAVDDDRPWHERLTAQANGLRRIAREHPSAFGLLLTRRARTDASLRVRDAVLDALREAGVPEGHVPRAERLLSTFAFGFAASEAGGRFPHVGDADEDFAYALEMIRYLIERAAAGPQPTPAGPQPTPAGPQPTPAGPTSAAAGP